MHFDVFCSRSLYFFFFLQSLENLLEIYKKKKKKYFPNKVLRPSRNSPRFLSKACKIGTFFLYPPTGNISQ